MSGLELLEAVRKDRTLQSIPFFMITAEADKKNIMKAIDAGVSNYIVKPFNIGTLKKKMSRISPFNKKNRKVAS